LTQVKIEAHGHLGDFSKEYFIGKGEEIKGMVAIWKEFVVYVLRGKEKVIMEVLGELAAIEALEKEKRD